MKDSKAVLGMYDNEDFSAILWETELGKVLVCKGSIKNVNSNISIKDFDGNYIKEVDMRNVLMSIIPIA